MTPSTSAIVLRWVCRTPLGTPVEPEVYMSRASSPSSRGSTRVDGSWRASALVRVPSGPVLSSVTFCSATNRSSRATSPGCATMCVAPESRIACRSAASGNR